MAKGGARPGAGRKPKAKIPFIAKKDAESVLEHLGKDIELPTADGGKRKQKLPTRLELWITLLLAADLRVRLQALSTLEDREFGKPAQRTEVTGKDGGPIPVILHTIRFGDGNSDR